MERPGTAPVVQTFSQSKAPVSMLVIGKSGAGKTTLINAFVNYFSGKQYEDNPLVLIPQSKDQKCSFPEYKESFDPNEFVEGNEGKPKTQLTKSYYICSGEKSLLIIDTPGLGDIRGSEQDQANVNNIIEGIQKTSFIHAVIFVIEPHFKKDIGFRYYVDQIRKLLTKSSTEQFIVVCTRNSGKIEEDLIDIFTESLGFKPDLSRWFCIDNKRSSKAHYNKASKTFNKIYEMAASFPKIHTKDFDELYQKRKAMQEEIQEMISAIEACKAGYKFQLKVAENSNVQKDQLQKLIKEESAKQHTKPTRSTNYNCKVCHQTCALNISGWFFGLFAEKIDEEGNCDVCHHSNSMHAKENQIRFTGLDKAMLVEILIKLDGLVDHLAGHLMIDALIDALNQALQIIIDDKMDRIASLTVDIERLGIVEAEKSYDSFIFYLDNELYLVDNDQTLDPETKKGKKDGLQKQKDSYSEMKSRHFQACYRKESISDELMQKSKPLINCINSMKESHDN